MKKNENNSEENIYYQENISCEEKISTLRKTFILKCQISNLQPSYEEKKIRPRMFPLFKNGW